MPTQVKQESACDAISESDLARLIVDTLHLELDVKDVDPAAPLFGDGLGLDSIDMLEIVLSISKKYGVALRSEDRPAFTSIRALTAHINRQRPK
ncbi:Phosphopantetheine-binding protein [Nitrospira japonica]|uniref:Phosphopantetheine-binding protein n=1 Tax=Nitrospira japonica TaxID=1325564 RepID=A0A1W1I1F6_9BACT|nr:phosphopantetheine-binding protein [Nitrospira japonica]SLM46838.1 Phosphopantetheine-binding protein [Nitrospira japonica]